MEIRGYGEIVDGVIDFNFECGFAIVAMDTMGNLSVTDDNFPNEGYVGIFDTAEFDTDEWHRAMINFLNATVRNGYAKIYLMDNEDGDFLDREWFLSDWSGRKVDDLISDIEEKIMSEIEDMID